MYLKKKSPEDGDVKVNWNELNLKLLYGPSIPLW
jgi:hypothetical protein